MATTSPRSLRRIPLALLAATIVLLGAAALDWLPPDSRACRGVAVLFGLIILSGALIRPAWFWNARKARRGRAALGDGPYASLLIAMGLVMVYLGLLSETLQGCKL